MSLQFLAEFGAGEKRKKFFCTFEEKVRIINAYDDFCATSKNPTLQAFRQTMSEKLGFPENLISLGFLGKLMRDRDSIIVAAANSGSKRRKVEVRYPLLEEAIKLYVRAAARQGVNITLQDLSDRAQTIGALAVEEKAVDADKLPQGEEGWKSLVRRIRRDERYGQKRRDDKKDKKKKRSRRKKKDDDDDEDGFEFDWIDIVRSVENDPERIFNADESVLLWRKNKTVSDEHPEEEAPPLHTELVDKKEKVILFITSSLSGHVVMPFVVGTWKKPLSCEKRGQLPGDIVHGEYVAKKDGFTDSTVFAKYLLALNAFIKQTVGKKCVLIVDNVASHAVHTISELGGAKGLEFVDVHVLPKKCKRTQSPANCGINSLVKGLYKKKLRDTFDAMSHSGADEMELDRAGELQRNVSFDLCLDLIRKVYQELAEGEIDKKRSTVPELVKKSWDASGLKTEEEGGRKKVQSRKLEANARAVRRLIEKEACGGLSDKGRKSIVSELLEEDNHLTERYLDNMPLDNIEAFYRLALEVISEETDDWDNNDMGLQLGTMAPTFAEALNSVDSILAAGKLCQGGRVATLAADLRIALVDAFKHKMRQVAAAKAKAKRAASAHKTKVQVPSGVDGQ
uniref:DDE-1 domain-containing protein n=1 Tax=Palpitomonas bilix TaxID=652834 RepID=A0A7S3DLF2_9EUKA|mmetsp:Transcript_41148/g.106338  ORF Transcript_41148/g.106338 Transcript_41148/m.106338 type:complete len:624 (+) Transcript_41148:75-1946(+)|eukprot:CAMPEP_0113876682 /NCGR_PEP_ID=MMETSP0780_2-20120614/5627_1 /TAXON_ID=652834 /ORGANISM="Palpitomonas bilix" /LENGTH=623 /DNA_ID=CAMNT_0000862797 /DNA_START=24 /DNA_END=1895 /DNA_ORIENTATION=+ /assembly_acc=CAM_ASM_000599